MALPTPPFPPAIATFTMLNCARSQLSRQTTHIMVDIRTIYTDLSLSAGFEYDVYITALSCPSAEE